MPEIRTELNSDIINITYVCDRCGDGNMESISGTMSPALINKPHRCKICGYLESYSEFYPRVQVMVPVLKV